MAKQSSKDRVAEAAAAVGLNITITLMPESTRTAEEAAKACKCTVGQIVKSLIFQREDTEELVLLLIAGNRQADLEAAAQIVGGPLTRADARHVRKVTGFAIGGVAPLGHLSPIPVYMDASLLTHDLVWAAAGAPNAVFAVNPQALKEAISAHVMG